jgi:hypothetical protein
MALDIEIIWALIYTELLWGNVVKIKYLKSKSMEEWFSIETKSTQGYSII